MEIREALKGLKIVDLSWMIMGPLMTKVLADYGAEVIKIESSTNIDRYRTQPPAPDGKTGLNRSGSFMTVNSSKFSLGLNLNHPKAGLVLRRLVLWTDVLIENLAPGTVKKWGLAYEQVKEVKPDIIMLSGSIQGRTGPQFQQRGFGDLFSAMMGFQQLTGRPNRSPLVTFSPYTDFIAVWYGLVAIIAALMYRRRTGKGQYIDISQIETSSHFLSPALLDYAVNGRKQCGNGNRAAYGAPHGIYRCKGDDRWCAIATFTDEEWKALCTVMGNPELAKDQRVRTFVDRKKNEDELDKIIESWTVQHPPYEVMKMLQAVGVPCGVVQSGQDLSQDPNLRERGFFQTIEDPELGRCTYARSAFLPSKTPCQMDPAPALGEHTEYVCTNILGIPDSDFIELLSEGVFD